VPVRAHDQGFVAAPPDRVYRTLTDQSTYPGWWPGARVQGGALRVPLPRPVGVQLHGHREGIGLHLAAPSAALEWYLEAFDDGTVVNAFLELPDGSTARRRPLLRLRGRLRQALVGLHRALGDPG
jgi:uncharacterized protein YndB with AHSA1/START domain